MYAGLRDSMILGGADFLYQHTPVVIYEIDLMEHKDSPKYWPLEPSQETAIPGFANWW